MPECPPSALVLSESPPSAQLTPSVQMPECSPSECSSVHWVFLKFTLHAQMSDLMWLEQNTKYKKLWYMYMLKDTNDREYFEEVNFKAETTLIWKGSEISYINLIFVRIEFCCLCEQHYKEL